MQSKKMPFIRSFGVCIFALQIFWCLHLSSARESNVTKDFSSHDHISSVRHSAITNLQEYNFGYSETGYCLRTPSGALSVCMALRGGADNPIPCLQRRYYGNNWDWIYQTNNRAYSDYQCNPDLQVTCTVWKESWEARDYGCWSTCADLIREFDTRDNGIWFSACANVNNRKWDYSSAQTPRQIYMGYNAQFINLDWINGWTYDQAMQSCAATLNGWLAIPTSGQSNLEISQQIAGPTWGWIGGTYNGRSVDWVIPASSKFYRSGTFLTTGQKISIRGSTNEWKTSASSTKISYVCQTCEPGTYVPYTAPESPPPDPLCQYCPKGQYTPSYGTKLKCSFCPAGKTTPYSGHDSSSYCTDCTNDQWSFSGGDICCSPGYIPSALQGGVCMACSAGTYWSKDPILGCLDCPAGKFSNEGQTSCSLCPVGTFAANARTPGACTPAPAGTYIGTPGASAVTQLCADGEFAVEGASVCSPCATAGVANIPVTIQSWTTNGAGYGISRDSCVCKSGKSGSWCNLDKCDDNLRGVSLGFLLLASNTRLRQFSQMWSTSTDYLKLVNATVNDLVFKKYDISGDGTISRDEFKANLKYSGIVSDDLPYLWCPKMPSTEDCTKEDSIIAKNFYESIIENFLTSEDHRFDFTGTSYLSDMISTYPDPSYPDDKCILHDQSSRTGFITQTVASPIQTTWKFNGAPLNADQSTSVRKRVCGFVNGNLARKFVDDQNLVSGAVTTFEDATNFTVSGTKRIYCISVEYQSSATNTLTAFTKVECSVGLYYDGTPLDLEPFITDEGVAFSFLDTSSYEDMFEVFSGSVNSNATAKDFLVGIPYASFGCGRTARHITILDKLHLNDVGLQWEYGVRALFTDAAQKSRATSMSTALFRIPFYSKISGQIVTTTGEPVDGVSVDLCHVDPLTGQQDFNIDFCPYTTVVTDKNGYFVADVLVSDPKWTRLIEYFIVTPSKVDDLVDGTQLDHVFIPSSRRVSINHLDFFTKLQFTDNSTMAVNGQVSFDPDIVNQMNCPMPGVPIHLIDDRGALQTTTSSSDGSFTFAIARGSTASVFIPEYLNYRWKPNIVYANDALFLESRRLLVEDEDIQISINVFNSSILESPSNPFIYQSRQLQSVSGAPSFSPTIKTSVPSRVPTRTPTRNPSTSPSLTPSAPSTLPSLFPTRSPTFQPTTRSPTFQPTTRSPTRRPTSPTRLPTYAPTKPAPTVFISNYSAPQLLYDFLFDGKAQAASSNPIQVYDSSGAISVNLVQVGLDGNGNAVFSGKPGVEVPHIRFPFAVLGNLKIVTFEFWMSFGPSNPYGSTVLSFGNPSTHEIVYKSGYKSKSFHTVFVFNPEKKVTKVYLNGTLATTTVIPPEYFSSPALGPNSLLTSYNFFGRSPILSSITQPKLDATLSCFRIWSGELPQKTITKNFLVGYGSNTISLSSQMTATNIQVSFKSISKQKVAIQFYGGKDIPILGSNYGFRVKANPAPGTTCDFEVNLPLDDKKSSVTALLPAMNLTVIASDVDINLPNNIDTNKNSKTSFCGSTEDSPYEYLSKAGQTVQDVTIQSVPPPDSTYTTTFIYHSPVCFEVDEVKDFIVAEEVDGSIPNNACFTKDSVKTLEQGKNTSVKILLFERYWDISSNTPEAKYTYNVPGATVHIRDDASGGAAFEQEYDSTPISATNPKPNPLGYVITGAVIVPVFPFASKFNIYVERVGPEGISRVSGNDWLIPVLGVVENEVPNYFPVSTDQNLIFFVIRDPPGGGSSTTVHAGTTIDFGISLENMYTRDYVTAASASANVGVDIEDSAIVGVGVMASKRVNSLVGGVEVSTGGQVTMSHSRASSTHYQLSMTFEYEFSTSSDPFLAGHMSDIIVGGGLDIIVARAYKVLVNKIKSTGNRLCINATEVQQWIPSAPSLFVLSVYEIEMVIDRLNSINSQPAQASNKPNITKYINNWNGILQTYRSHNLDQSDLFHDETLLMHSMVKSFKKFQAGMESGDDFVKAFDQLLFGFNIPGLKSIIHAGFSELETACSNLQTQKLMGYDSEFVQCTDSDLDPRTWNSFSNLIDAACSMGSPDDAKKNPLINSQLIKAQCQQDRTKDESDPTYNQPAMFDFLKKNDTYLTFGAGSPMSLTWTSSVTNSYSFSTALDASKALSMGLSGGLQIGIFGASFGANAAASQDVTVVVSIGKTSETSHSFERSVSVIFDDQDPGDYFVIRMTQDTVYGTPIFTTMGGQSKCPGETGTSRRESEVKIYSVNDMCGSSRDQPCKAVTSNFAYFGIEIINMSPTSDDADYQLDLVQKYDTLEEGVIKRGCGVKGNINDLYAYIKLPISLGGIPYDKKIEKIVVIPKGGVCLNYKEIEIMAIATCEAEMSVYQYGTEKDPKTGKVSVSYNPANRIYPSNSTRTLTFSFDEMVPDKFSVNSEQKALAQSTEDMVAVLYNIMFIVVVSVVAGFFMNIYTIYMVTRVKVRSKMTYRMMSQSPTIGFSSPEEAVEASSSDDANDKSLPPSDVNEVAIDFNDVYRDTSINSM